MEMMTLKQYAESQGISYEAVRRQVNRYAEELSDHIVKQDRKQFIDQWAVDFLTEKRRESPIILQTTDQSEEIDQLKQEIESLRTKLMTAQERIIGLQDENKVMIETKIRYDYLLELHEDQKEQLQEARDQAAALRMKQEEDQREIEALRKERDEAQTEAQSFQKTIFGFYRKK